MSSWRNLMTPPQEKYYINEGSPSLEDSYCQEKFHHEVSDFTEEVPRRQPVIQSQKFKELHNQLNQLKDDLGRSTIQAKDLKGSVMRKQVSPFEKSDFFESTPRPTLQTKRKGILRGTQEQELYSASTCSGFSRKFLSKEVEVRAFDQSGGMYLEPSLDEKTLENKADEELFSSRTRRSSIANKSILSTQRQEKKSNKKVEFKCEESQILKSNNKLQETLYECCQQISELKQIALDSQKQIASLCGEVVRQKNASEEVRKHLGLSVRETPVKKTNYSSAKTYLKHSNVLKDSTSSQEDSEPHWTQAKNKQTKNISPAAEEAPLSWRGQRIKDRRTVSSLIGNYCEESTKESSSLRQSRREASVQCDAMLDAIIDHDEEESQQREKEIKSLKAEINTYKEQKNDMISIFQQMLSQLEDSEKRDAQILKEKVTETQQTFSSFYTTFNTKLQNIDHQRLGSSKSYYKSRSQMK